MPAKSSKQYGFMQGILHGSITGGKSAPSRSVAREFVDATPAKKRHKFAEVLAGKKKKRKGD